ncbi:hypothetical protein CBOM_03672 [Ceraceosorus bombacis]|uniref:Uncharacterized protein n=1 Tax=Ceraceosorus bombacis TaxID=401625 RepID=A0A0P1BGJ8_9BASI|nr:hypothetical protein CBOM_03672 [Ceraceosorus bombacis]
MGQAGAARLGGDKSAVRPAAERAKAKKRSLVDSVGGQATSDSSLLLTSFAKREASEAYRSTKDIL